MSVEITEETSRDWIDSIQCMYRAIERQVNEHVGRIRFNLNLKPEQSEVSFRGHVTGELSMTGQTVAMWTPNKNRLLLLATVIPEGDDLILSVTDRTGVSPAVFEYRYDRRKFVFMRPTVNA